MLTVNDAHVLASSLSHTPLDYNNFSHLNKWEVKGSTVVF